MRRSIGDCTDAVVARSAEVDKLRAEIRDLAATAAVVNSSHRQHHNNHRTRQDRRSRQIVWTATRPERVAVSALVAGGRGDRRRVALAHLMSLHTP